MGGAASALAENSEYAKMDETLRNEMADLFISEYQKLKDTTADDDSIRENFTERLIAKEREIIARREDLQTKFRSNALAVIKDRRKSGFADIALLVNKKLASFKSKHSLTFLIAVDGSATSDISFNNILSMRKHDDNIVIYHSYHPGSQASKPAPNKMAAIKTKYEALLIGNLPTQNHYLCIDELINGEEDREMVLNDLITKVQLQTESTYDHKFFSRHVRI